MSQERWDIVLRFLSGPLSFQGDIVCRGPVVRIGAAPGPGGMSLEGYRAIDDRHAVISCYDGESITIGPVGGSPVRVGTNEYADWEEVLPLSQPAYLTAGNAIHLGPLGRGATFLFVEAQRLGVWEKRQIISDAAQAEPEFESSEVKVLDAKRGIPKWFIPSIILLFLFTTALILIRIVPTIIEGSPEPIGVAMEGVEYVSYVDITEPIEPHLLEGLNKPFFDFVMGPNAEVARWPALGKNPKLWDSRFQEYTTRAVKTYARMRAFWRRLEVIRDDYAYVTRELRQARLPEVFAGIPYQESRYTAKIQSKACAEGWWQFIPETAKRANIEVRECKFRGTNTYWTPKRIAPVRNVMKNAPYVQGGERCRIDFCRVDERQDIAISTRGALYTLGEAWRDPMFKDSGAAIQLSILSHNAGYDDSRYEERRVNRINIKWAYKRHLRNQKLERAPDFYGVNIRCGDLRETDYDSMSAQCGGVLWNHTQHYAYNIVAQHLLAVCYYAKNYSNNSAFSPWRAYARSDAYCEKVIDVPTDEDVRKWGSK